MKTPMLNLNVSRLLAALALAGLAGQAAASADAMVFPVAGVFWNAGNTAIDQRFMQSQDIGQLKQQVKATLEAAFAGRIRALTKQSAANTFAVSFHLTRMAAYYAPKADGNYELMTPVTGSVYFTNVATGEILFTTTSTNAAAALLPAAVLTSGGKQAEEDKLYAKSLAALIAQLGKQAGADFQPKTIETTVTGQQNGLLLLSSGYRQGIQSGDSLDDDQSQNIKVVYAAADYAVARIGLADAIGTGARFHKFVVGKIDGRLRPRATVVMDQVPEGFSADYLTQLFSEELAAKAPLTMVQVNPSFAGLLRAVVQNADLSSSTTSQRDTPDLIVRLRVSDPIQHETNTNLGFQTKRGVQAKAYAELIDTSGRVLFAAAGHDAQTIDVVRGLDLAPQARREIAIKNALLALAQKMGEMAEGQPDTATVKRADADGVLVATPNQVYANKAPGYVLHPTQFNIGGKSRSVLFPVYEAVAGARNGADTALATLLPLGKGQPAVQAGDVFEALRLGTAPKSATAFTLCPDAESLGSVKTPDFENVSSVALARAMPGPYYAPEVRQIADATIHAGSGFSAAIKWDVPTVALCVQPVQRVDAGAEECGDTCQRAMTARYTLRQRKDGAVVAKQGLEGNFKSTGYQKSSRAGDVSKLILQDVLDEADKLMGTLATKIVLPTTN
ncbi:hypothetical protein SAMN02982985_04266 [Rugamonas rubra]|uniref:Uncharacterized protein n=2 Tax=Rugamonas rubra TaxID=758825 RepID=A0A1I4RD37_9BURK|nr:hypothetical protein SAMN02982985_04266 [Rugamonas rubra]